MSFVLSVGLLLFAANAVSVDGLSPEAASLYLCPCQNVDELGVVCVQRSFPLRFEGNTAKTSSAVDTQLMKLFAELPGLSFRIDVILPHGSEISGSEYAEAAAAHLEAIGIPRERIQPPQVELRYVDVPSGAVTPLGEVNVRPGSTSDHGVRLLMQARSPVFCRNRSMPKQQHRSEQLVLPFEKCSSVLRAGRVEERLRALKMTKGCEHEASIVVVTHQSECPDGGAIEIGEKRLRVVRQVLQDQLGVTVVEDDSVVLGQDEGTVEFSSAAFIHIRKTKAQKR